jgi:1,4-alpha-glucan branching enzyme
MLKKKYLKTKDECRVTFELPAEANAKTAFLCAEFNNWDTTSHLMKRRKDGSFVITISLKPDHRYRFRYFLDGERWENDWNADAYVSNAFGSEDSVVET